HFHSAYTTGAQRAGTGVLASHLNRFHTQLGAGLLPSKALRRVGLRLDLSTRGDELVSGNPQAGGHGSEELIEGVHASATSGSAYPAHGGAAAGGAVGRILAISDVYRNRLERKAQRLCRHDVDHSPRPGAEVLAPQIYLHGAIGMNVHIAIAVVPTATPGVEADSQATLDGTGSLVAARVPVLLPINQFSSLAKFLPVHVRALAREVGVLGEELKRVHVQLSGKVLKSSHRKQRRLGVVRRPPSARGTGIRADRGVASNLVGYAGEDVGKGRHGSARRAPRAPGVRLPSNNRPVFLCRHFNLCEAGRSRPGHFQIHVALEQQFDGLAGKLRQPGVLNTPTVGRELAAKPSADVLADGLNVVVLDIDACQPQCFTDFTRYSGYVLRGEIGLQGVRTRPLSDATVCLKAAVCDHGHAVVTVGNDQIWVAESLARIPTLLTACRF